MHGGSSPQACRNWAFLGRCDYGDSCPFVHSSFSPLDSSSGDFRASSVYGSAVRAVPIGVSSMIGSAMNQDLLVSNLNQRERILSTSPFLLPELIQNKYHSLLLLDAVQSGSAGTAVCRPSGALGNIRTACYKALGGDGSANVYCLRRIEGFMLSNYDLVQETIGRWTGSNIGSHPNLVTLRSAFVTQEFQECEGFKDLGGSLVMVYEYVDQAMTLEQFLSQAGHAISEQFFVDVLLQGLAAIAFVHGQNLAIRAIAPSKLLLSGPQYSRVHLNCVGVLDVFMAKTAASVAGVKEAQRQDLAAFGKILDELRPANSSGTGAYADGQVQSVVADLLGGRDIGASELVSRLGTAYAGRAGDTLLQGDFLASEYRKSVDLGRSLDLLLKVNSIADRPGLFDDWRWAGTGERYIVSLFRDYLFFQLNEFGAPVLDVGHNIDALCKVDAGSTESVMLMSRDAASVLVVSYLDIRRAIDNAFRELLAAHTPSTKIAISSLPPQSATH